MPASLPPETITAIIISFLQGLTRDAIADKLDISQGSVSNALQNLKNTIGEPTFKILKELGKHLQQNDVSFDDVIIGFHIKSLLKKEILTRIKLKVHKIIIIPKSDCTKKKEQKKTSFLTLK